MTSTNFKGLVNNESSEIIRILNDFETAATDTPDLYPQNLRKEIDEMNAWM